MTANRWLLWRLHSVRKHARLHSSPDARWRPEEASRWRGPRCLLAQRSGSAGHVRELSFSDTPQGIVYWNTIYIQLGLDALPGRPADDELANLMPTIFEHVDALGIYTFDADRRAGQLRPLRAA